MKNLIFIRNLHYFSGLTIAIFTFLHLFNHLLAFGGIENHIQWMRNLRLIYRNPLIESLLLIAVLTQIISGITLFRKKVFKNAGFYEKLQMISGAYLAFFLTLHVSAVLVGRFILSLDTNFYFGAVGLNHFPTLLFFIPYYFLAVNAIFVHIAAIHQLKMQKFIKNSSANFQAQLIIVFILFGIFISMLILMVFTGNWYSIEIPQEYNVVVGK